MLRDRTLKTAALAALMAMFFCGPAAAHIEGGITGGFLTGFEHPISGWDHITAMFAVGLWGAFLGRTAIWVLPVVFPVIMAFGGALGVLGVPIPYVEIGIALSAISLGLAIVFQVRVPLAAATAAVAVFAVCHGYAHGVELPGATNPFAFSVGFVTATGLLHLAGIAFGYLIQWPSGKVVVRALGAAIAAAGFAFLTGFA